MYCWSNLLTFVNKLLCAKNLKKRFNQYTSRSTGIFSKTDKINQNFYIEVQQNLQNSLDYSQVFQRFVVYTWVDEKKST